MVLDLNIHIFRNCELRSMRRQWHIFLVQITNEIMDTLINSAELNIHDMLIGKYIIAVKASYNSLSIFLL